MIDESLAGIDWSRDNGFKVKLFDHLMREKCEFYFNRNTRKMCIRTNHL